MKRILLFTILLFLTGCSTSENITETTLATESLATSAEESTSETLESILQKQEMKKAYQMWKSDVPEIYQDTWEEYGLTYEWNASVILPQAEGFPYNQKTAVDFSQETADRVISYFTAERSPVSLKDYISYTAYRADLKDLCTVSDSISRIWDYRFHHSQYSYMETDLASLQYTHDNSADKLKFYQSDYLLYKEANLPVWNMDDDKIHRLYESFSDYGKMKEVNGIVMAFPNDMGLYDLLAITDHVDEYADDQRYIKYISYDQSKVQTGLLEEEADFTRNQAIQKADELLAEFGIDYLIPGQVKFLAGYYTIYYKTLNTIFDYPEHLSNRLPMPLTMDSDGKYAEHEFSLMECYDAYITISQDHLREISLPLLSYDTVTLDELSYDELLTFSDMMEEYKHHFKEIARFMNERNLLNNKKSHIVIKEIRLLNMYSFHGWSVNGSDAYAEYRCIPTWCFFGYIDTGLELNEEIMWSQHHNLSDGNCLIGTVRAAEDLQDTRFIGETRDTPLQSSEYSQDIIVLGPNNYLAENDGLAHIIGN